MPTNPFFEPWSTPFGAPPFDRIRPEHFRPAYDAALSTHRAEIAAIANTSAPPSFDNTILALERSGKALARIEHVFHNLCASDTNLDLKAIEREMAPLLARHSNTLYLDTALFDRINDLFERRDSLSLDEEQRRLLERYHLDFVRAGAQLGEKDKARLADIGEELAELATQFAQAVLADEEETVLGLTASDVAGLPEFALAAAAEIARERRLDAPYAATAARGSVEAILSFADHRDTRERIFKAWASRGARGNGNDNRARIVRILALRQELAELLGYANFAAYRLADTMAKTPQAARDLLSRVRTPAIARARQERTDLEAMIAAEGGNFALEPWDWRYYAEKLRKARYDLDEAELMAYLPLDAMLAAAFDAAHRLFGLNFVPRSDVPVYHDDVRVWEVRRGAAPIGLFYGDYFARSSKRGGAWMSSFRDQEAMDAAVLPLIVNNCNFAKPPQSRPALLSYDEARTLFHEFGHALHGLLSHVRYPRLAGTNVAQDFVELPSQIFEHWLDEQLPRFARHADSGAPIPLALLERLKAARHFNQGFATSEFLASAFADLDLHEQSGGDPHEIAQRSAKAIGLLAEIAPRHAPAHFLHIFAGDGYAAGYYSYLWAEVLDADGFAAFTEAGDAFAPAIAQRLHDHIYAAGGSRDYTATYRAFRGRDPNVAAMLEGRGLA